MDRVDAVRTALMKDYGMAELVARDCDRHGTFGATLLKKAFFPDLEVSVVEAFAGAGDRVVVVVEVSARGKTWEAVVIARFSGDEVVEVRAVTDPLPWLQLLGVVPDDAELERALGAVTPRT